MKYAEKKVKIVKVEYWCCNNPFHHHKTEEIANGCIQKSSNKKQDAAYFLKISQRNDWIVNLYKKGAKKADLARQFDLSGTRIHSIIGKFERNERNMISNVARKNRVL